jgi:alkylation response protein AidB-like acyl-CoA dehydrogenase
MPTAKPHRAIVGRVTGYADEAAAYLRRRRMTRKPFARVQYSGGRTAAYDPDSEAGRAVFLAAAKLIDAAG